MERYTKCKTNGSCRNKMQRSQKDDRLRFDDGSLFALLAVIHIKSLISYSVHVFCLESIIIIRYYYYFIIIMGTCSLCRQRNL